MEQNARSIAYWHFYDNEGIETFQEVEHHTTAFMDSDYYRPEQFNNRDFGYNPIDVLLGQLDQYDREVLGLEPEGTL